MTASLRRSVLGTLSYRSVERLPYVADSDVSIRAISQQLQVGTCHVFDARVEMASNRHQPARVQNEPYKSSAKLRGARVEQTTRKLVRKVQPTRRVRRRATKAR